MLAMFTALCFVFLLSQTSADPAKNWFRCDDRDDNSTSMTFTPSLDKVMGRYTAELCSLKNPEWTELTVDLTYNDNAQVCTTEPKPVSKNVRRPGHQHSVNTLMINGTNSCTRICYSMDFDLIFSSCYLLKSTFKKNKTTCAPFDSYHLIDNNITKEYFASNKPHVSFVNHDEGVTLYWFLGIPPVDYRVVLCDNLNSTLQSECSNPQEMTQNCSVSGREPRALACSVSPALGCYRAVLEHGGPWVAGVFTDLANVFYEFCHRRAAAPHVSAGGAWPWWACGGALLGGAALAGAALLRRALRRRAFHKHVLDAWRQQCFSEAGSGARAATEPRSRPVLLLYAREGPHGDATVAALKDLVQEATQGPVYDIYSPEVTALCASCPATWVRDVLQHEHVRVLLLQTPALAALYCAPLSTDHAALTLRSPLLGGRAMYRSPQFGSQLLQLALRHVADTHQLHHAYHKYYIATLSSLETEVVPHVVAYRRYSLPAAGAVLARDLAPPGRDPAPPGRDPAPAGPPGRGPHPARLHALAAAARAFVQHVQENPDYLMDELIIT